MQGSDRFPAAGAASAGGRPAVRAAEAGTAAPGDDAPGGAAQRRIDTRLDEHDRWNAHVRGEGPLQRADRAYGEILQEIRVAQTGVQILFAFLLTLAFTARFRSITATQRDMYVLTLMLCAAATALLSRPPPVTGWSTAGGSSASWCGWRAGWRWPGWCCCCSP